jgi:hypothetical protein
MPAPAPSVAAPARIPADIELPDKVLGPLTARQLTVLAATAAALYGLWQATRPVLPSAAFLAIAVPLLAAAAAVVVLRRDGLPLDRLLVAAIRHHTAGTHRVTTATPVGPVPAWLAATATSAPELPRRVRTWQPSVRMVTAPGATAGADVGVVDLGPDGLAVIATASTVNFALRTPAEQEALVAGFGRYLHSLTAPVQILIRAERVDLTDPITRLLDHAEHLPDPGLARLAREHADFLAHLAGQTELLRRQVLLVWRDPLTAGSARRRTRRGRPGVQARRAAQDRLARRVNEAAELLAPIGITVTPLDAAHAAVLVAAAANPGLPQPPSLDTAGPGEVITTAGGLLAGTAAAEHRDDDSRRARPGHNEPGDGWGEPADLRHPGRDPRPSGVSGIELDDVDDEALEEYVHAARRGTRWQR